MKTTINIEGMSCRHCVMAVKKEIQKLDVQSININIEVAVVEFDEEKVNVHTIKNAIKSVGDIVVD